jgi:hypothetical protein
VRGLVLPKRVESMYDSREGSKKDEEGGKVLIDRARLDALSFEKQPLMGTAFRSPITGEVALRNYSFPNFSVVDLWTRPRLCKTVGELAKDIYVFRPRPLAYRTWIYHHMYREKAIVPEVKDDTTSIENRLLKHVLMQRCIDKKMSAGRWSSLMTGAPIAVAACLTSDIPLMGFALGLCMILYFITLKISEPKWYHLARLISLIPRVAFVIFLFMRLGVVLANFTPQGALGMVIMFGLMAVDFIKGDVSTFVNYRYTCTYEIVKTLPNRVFVVRQIGGAIGFHPEEVTYSREQRLTIMGSLDSAQKLVADIEGLLVELEPLDVETVLQIKSQQEDAVMDDSPENRPPRFLGLDVFNEDVPSVLALKAAEEEKDMFWVGKLKGDTLTTVEEASSHD